MYECLFLKVNIIHEWRSCIACKVVDFGKWCNSFFSQNFIFADLCVLVENLVYACYFFD